MTKIKVTSEYDYLSGHLRYGSAQLIIDKDEWEKLSEEEKMDKLSTEAEIVNVDYEIEDCGNLSKDFRIEEIN